MQSLLLLTLSLKLHLRSNLENFKEQLWYQPGQGKVYQDNKLLAAPQWLNTTRVYPSCYLSIVNQPKDQLGDGALLLGFSEWILHHVVATPMWNTPLPKQRKKEAQRNLIEVASLISDQNPLTRQSRRRANEMRSEHYCLCYNYYVIFMTFHAHVIFYIDM